MKLTLPALILSVAFVHIYTAMQAHRQASAYARRYEGRTYSCRNFWL